MKNIFLSNLTTLPTQVTGASILFKQAFFYAVSGFNASGIPTFDTGKLYLGTVSGNQPIVITSGAAYVVTSINETDGQENLSTYFVSPQNGGDGCFVSYD